MILLLFDVIIALHEKMILATGKRKTGNYNNFTNTIQAIIYCKNSQSNLVWLFFYFGGGTLIDKITSVIQQLYLDNSVPWVIGYSGGKDSTTVIQLIWNAIAALPKAQRLKNVIHVISTDTLIEQPVMQKWVALSSEKLQRSAQLMQMPFKTHLLEPDVNDTFWVCMIGRGYAYPRQKFRWCTERLKIRPSNAFVCSIMSRYGESILVLGTRKAESTERARTMEKYEAKRTRDYLSPSGSMENQLVFSPLEDWTTDDIWNYLLNNENPWGISNKELLNMYQGASDDDGGEPGLTGDINSKSWGNSRFGCWMCTLVKTDKSMAAMIKNNEEKKWLSPLMEFRNYIMANDRVKRDFRRTNGRIHLFNGRLVHGPYKKEVRQDLLRKLLQLQNEVRQKAPAEFKDITLISIAELKKIRQIWLDEKHEFDDALPDIYFKVTGAIFPDEFLPGNAQFKKSEYELFAQVCGELYPDEELMTELVAGLLDISVKAKATGRRRKALDDIEAHIRRCMYRDENDALNYALQMENRRRQIKEEINDNSDIRETEN